MSFYFYLLIYFISIFLFALCNYLIFHQSMNDILILINNLDVQHLPGLIRLTLFFISLILNIRLVSSHLTYLCRRLYCRFFTQHRLTTNSRSKFTNPARVYSDLLTHIPGKRIHRLHPIHFNIIISFYFLIPFSSLYSISKEHKTLTIVIDDGKLNRDQLRK